MAKASFEKWKFEGVDDNNYIMTLFYNFDANFMTLMLEKKNKVFSHQEIEENKEYKLSDIEHHETVAPVIENKIKKEVKLVSDIVKQPDKKQGLRGVKILNNGVKDLLFRKEGNVWKVTIITHGKMMYI
ncbi:MAG: hypothetical protein [Siphoviridae sp. ctjeG17]|nr:MAG: hypothetical protein [Siphoviridae sp. ctjeG17]